MLLLIPAIDAQPVIIGFNGTIDQNIIKEHNIANYIQYKTINAISAIGFLQILYLKEENDVSVAVLNEKEVYLVNVNIYNGKLFGTV